MAPLFEIEGRKSGVTIEGDVVVVPGMKHTVILTALREGADALKKYFRHIGNRNFRIKSDQQGTAFIMHNGKVAGEQSWGQFLGGEPKFVSTEQLTGDH